MSLIPSFHGHRRHQLVDPFAHNQWDPHHGHFPDPHNGHFPVRSSHHNYFPESSLEVSAYATASIDWKETLEAHVLKADLPGIWKREVRVEVEEDRVIQISGERNLEKEHQNDDTWHRCERSSGKFLRKFRMPENARMDQVKASMENGVLTIIVPKEKRTKNQYCKVVEISG
jgi:HSP20 family protein